MLFCGVREIEITLKNEEQNDVKECSRRKMQNGQMKIFQKRNTFTIIASHSTAIIINDYRLKEKIIKEVRIISLIISVEAKKH